MSRPAVPPPHEPDPRRSAVAVGILAGVLVLLAVLVVELMRPRPPVALIGDSITAMSATALHRRLDGDWSVTIDGRPGFRIDQQLDAARRIAARAPEQVVINLGTNDVNQGVDLAASAAAMEQMVSLFGSARCIHLVTVNESMLAGNLEARRGAETLNAAYRAIAEQDPRVRIIDWAAIVDGWQARHPGESITTDTVHPTDEGIDLLVTAYGEALASCER
jgi:hypothetical protein